MGDAAAPKLDYKMLVLPLVLFGSKSIDFKNPDTVKMFQAIFISVVFLLGTLYFYVYTRVNAKASNKKIWVPPKAKSGLPFGLGPAPAAVKKEDYEVTTYKEYELKLLKEAGSPLLMTVAMTMFMSIKFSIHMSLLMQSIMLPLNATDSAILKKYLLGSKVENIYGELSHCPTDEDVALLNPVPVPAETTTEAVEPSSEPRVEELPAEDEVVEEEDTEPKKSTSKASSASKSKASSKASKKAVVATAASELD